MEMDESRKPQISIEVPPYLRVHSDGTVQRLAGTQVTPPGLCPKTNVLSKDILIVPETGVTARLYRPNSSTGKLPLIIYFHGGAFCISSAADPLYHTSLNNLVAESNAVALSVNYRLAPEHPLPAAYHDAWDAIQWVASHAVEGRQEIWLKESVDFDSVFLAGDSAGANICHYMAIKLQVSEAYFKIPGLIMINPYFWGKEPIGVEIGDMERKRMVDTWWDFVCPADSGKGCDDPLINPFVEDAPALHLVDCNRVLVTVAERDILKERGKLYHKKLVNSGWNGKSEFHETEGEDHDFHIFDPYSHKANILIQRIAAFINQH